MVTAEVFKESTSYSDFGFSLLNTLRDGSLGALNHPVKDFLVMHNFNSLSADFSEHQITFLVVEGVMESIFRTLMKRVDERLNFIHASVGNTKHGLSSHGINMINIVFGANPFSLTKVLTNILGRQVPGVDGGKFVEVRERSLAEHSSTEDVLLGSRKHFYLFIYYRW